MPAIPARYAPILLAMFSALMMSIIMSGVITLLNLGPVADFLTRWMTAWLTAFVIAFPAMMVVAPIARRIVARLTVKE